MPQTVNIYYGSANVINGNVEQSAVVSGNGNTIEFSYEKANKAVSEIEEILKRESIPDEDKEIALEMLAEIRDKIEQKKKPAIVKSALNAVKDFIINAGGSLVGGLIQAKFMGLF